MRPENTRVTRKGLRATERDARERRRTDRRSRVQRAVSEAQARVALLPAEMLADLSGKFVPPAEADQD